MCAILKVVTNKLSISLQRDDAELLAVKTLNFSNLF